MRRHKIQRTFWRNVVITADRFKTLQIMYEIPMLQSRCQ